MKLNGAGRLAGMIFGFLTIIGTLVATYVDTRERLARNGVEIEAVKQRIGEVKADASIWMTRVEAKIDAHSVTDHTGARQ